ncbi:MAG: InlB B-repeat-containing protein [Candidatus Cloacimonetes bacterium]|nr:InlB B-repeat-containing protein [Candidatus Cloacimonadota bacterium]
MSLKKTWRKLFVLAIAGFLFFGTACTALESISSEISTSQTSSEPTYEGVQYDIYLLALNSGYDGTYEEWLASIRGEDGQSIELRLDEESGWMQWKYANEDDNSWRNLIEIEALIGPQGPKGDTGSTGTNGITPHIGENGNWWVGDIDTGISATGPQGESGSDGQDGTNGITPHIGENGNWWIGDIDTGIDANGIQGETGESGQSAYELYLENYPDYEGDEQQWLDDLINGNLGTKVYFTVTFDSNGGTIVDSQQVEDGRKATRPDEPTRTGYTFDGWYSYGDEKWVFSGYDVTENITLVASWTANSYTASFDSGNGISDIDEATYTFDSVVTLPVPTYTDHIFMGWYYNGDLVTNGAWKIADNSAVLEAKWVQTEYELNYDDYDNDGIQNYQVVEYGQPFTLVTPTREGYTFDGWFIDGERFEEGTWYYEEDITVESQWTANQYSIFLDPNGGTLNQPLTVLVTYDQPYTIPVPTTTSTPFGGWYLDNVRYTNAMGNSVSVWKGTSDVTLTAQYFVPIYNATDLANISNDLTEVYRLMNDIDLLGVEWIPLGNNLTPFTGIFDGQGYTISGINITTSQTYIGLFGYNEGTLKNIVLDQLTINVTGAIEQNLYGAGLVGYNEGLIDDITNLTGNIYIKARGGATAYVGGIVGYQNTSIELSYLHNDFMIEGDLATSVGGLVGYGSTITISNSYNSGAVSGSRRVGGLVGSGSTATISSSYNSGSVSGSYSVGGLVGEGFTTTISGSYNSGAVSGSNQVGGLVGHGYTTTISGSYNSGSVSAFDQVGGLVGYGYTTTISSSYNSGSVSGSYNGSVGGLVGYGPTTISSSYNSGAVSGGFYVGGLVGYGSTTISGSYNSGTVSASSGSVGGLVGRGSTAYIYYSLNLGDVTTSDSTSDIGGIIGYSIANVDQEHVYHTGLLTAAGVEVAGIDFGVKVDDLTVFNQDFFVTTLGWDIEMWDFTNLDIANEVYPSLMI